MRAASFDVLTLWNVFVEMWAIRKLTQMVHRVPVKIVGTYVIDISGWSHHSGTRFSSTNH